MGVGVGKQRFGIGSCVIMIADASGQIVNAKEMTGVTVFSRFQPIQDLIGKSLDYCFNHTVESDNRSKAIKMAIEKIQEQMSKEKSDPEGDNE